MHHREKKTGSAASASDIVDGMLQRAKKECAVIRLGKAIFLVMFGAACGTDAVMGAPHESGGSNGTAGQSTSGTSGSNTGSGGDFAGNTGGGSATGGSSGANGSGGTNGGSGTSSMDASVGP